MPAYEQSSGKSTVVKTLADYGYRRIRADILSGQIAAGSKLPLEKLSRQYEVGMSPLREALTRLVGEALVVSEGQRGFWVAPLSLAEFHDITRVRSLIEAEALQLSMQRGGPEWAESVRIAFANLNEVEDRLNDGGADLAALWEDYNRQFHEALVADCGSPWMLRLLKQLYQQSERYRRISLANSSTDRRVQDEHRAIFEAVMQGQVLKACRLAEVHQSRTAQSVTEAFGRLQSQDAPLETVADQKAG